MMKEKKLSINYLSELGAKIIKEERVLPYSLRYEVEYDNKRFIGILTKN